MAQSIIKDITRLQNSKNGNPRFHIIMEDGTEGTTKTDAGWAYSIDPWGWKGKKVNYEWKEYKSGFKVYGDIEEAQEQTFQVWADVEVAWCYEVTATSKEEALEMFNSGNHDFNVVEEQIGSAKVNQILDEDNNLTIF